MYDTLYAMGIDKTILVWKVRVHNAGQCSVIISEAGNLNGILTPTNKTISNGKNYGKANATTHYTQALKEADAIWAKKIQKGYKSLAMLELNSDVTDEFVLRTKLSSNKTDASGQLKPMLCKPFEYGKIAYPRIRQPKINGCRAFIKMIELNHGLFGMEQRVGITSKDGLLLNIPHIEQNPIIVRLLNELTFNCGYDKPILDCEIYKEGYTSPEISGASRNPNNPLNKLLYPIILDIAVENVPQQFRLKVLKYSFTNISETTYTNDYIVYNGDMLARVDNAYLYSDEETREWRDKYIEAGFEGIVIRDPIAYYGFGQRPNTIHKYKAVMDAEFRILDIIPQAKRNNLPQFIFMNDINNDTFELIGSGKHSKQEQYLINKDLYIGEYATVEYRERTKTGLPNHCTFIGIRKHT